MVRRNDMKLPALQSGINAQIGMDAERSRWPLLNAQALQRYRSNPRLKPTTAYFASKQMVRRSSNRWLRAADQGDLHGIDQGGRTQAENFSKSVIQMCQIVEANLVGDGG